MSSSAVNRIRRQVLSKPGFTRLPICKHCGQEIPLLQYGEHVKHCGKAAPASPAPVNGTNGGQATPAGLVYALFDPRAVARLEKAGAEILRLRQELYAKRDTLKAAERAQRNRDLARRECLSMAIVVAQLRRRFALQGSGAVFIPGLRPHIVDDHLGAACTELVRMTNPTIWGDT